MIQQFHFWKYTNRNERRDLTDICLSMCIAALFTIPKGQKQPKCLSIDKQINIILTYATWVNLEHILLSEIRHSEKNQYCMIPLIKDNLLQVVYEIHRDREQNGSYQDLGKWARGSQYLMSVEVIKCEVPITIKLICKTKKTQTNTNLSNAFFSSKSLKSDYLKILKKE